MARRPPVDAHVPGDKSISHRALLFAALADGESRLAGLLDAADTGATAAALRRLGVELPERRGDPLTVRGRGLHGLRQPATALDCGNSGTTARLLLGLLAGTPVQAVVTGDASLRRRPMRRVTGPLTVAGAAFEELEAEDRLPVRVRGARPLQPIQHHNARSSAQVKTALLLAGLTGGARIEVTEPHPSRDHSERLLAAMDAPIRAGTGADGGRVTLEPTSGLDPLTLRVPGDFSSAAFFLALGARLGAVRVPLVGTNPTRTGMLDVLRRMGADVTVEEGVPQAGEPVGNVVVHPGELHATTVTPEEVPTLLDEIPVLAALAATARGETRFDGVGELRVKESDRIRALAQNLAALGVETETSADSLVVCGVDRALQGTVEAHGDHRIAMAFGVLAALPRNRIEIRGRETAAISYPAFWDELERVNTELGTQ